MRLRSTQELCMIEWEQSMNFVAGNIGVRLLCWLLPKIFWSCTSYWTPLSFSVFICKMGICKDWRRKSEAELFFPLLRPKAWVTLFLGRGAVFAACGRSWAMDWICTKQWPEPLHWQRQTLNTPSHTGTPRVTLASLSLTSHTGKRPWEKARC